MGIEALTKWRTARRPGERSTIVLKSTDRIVRELTKPQPLGKLSVGARRIVERTLRANNRDRKVVVTGETEAIGLLVHLVELVFTHIR